jgi:hypothetical protein
MHLPSFDGTVFTVLCLGCNTSVGSHRHIPTVSMSYFEQDIGFPTPCLGHPCILYCISDELRQCFCRSHRRASMVCITILLAFIIVSRLRIVTGVIGSRLCLQVCVSSKINVRVPNDSYCTLVAVAAATQQCVPQSLVLSPYDLTLTRNFTSGFMLGEFSSVRVSESQRLSIADPLLILLGQ